nr:hypothetical protein [Tanacetum cinerariifolium]
MSRHKIKCIVHKKYLEDKDLDIGGDQKLETSTLGEFKGLGPRHYERLLASLFSEAGVIYMNWISLEHCIEWRGL